MPTEETETAQGRKSPLSRESEISQDESFDYDDEDFVKVEDEAVAAQVEQALAKLESKSFAANNAEIGSSETLVQELENISLPSQSEEIFENVVNELENKSLEGTKEEIATSETLVQEPNEDEEVSESQLSGDQGRGEDATVKDEIMSPRSTESESKPKSGEEKDAEDEEKAQVKEESGTIKEETEPLEIGEWAAFSQEIFSLVHFPSEWANPNLTNQTSNKDEKVWKRYFDSRCMLSKACEDPTDEHKEELSPSQVYKQKVEAAFKEEWKETVLGRKLLKQTYQRATKVTWDTNGMLTDATVVSTIFSPYFLPRAVQICMRYHRLPNDFWCTWHIQFVSLNDVKQDNMAYWRPHLTDMWELCSNGYSKVPTNDIGFFPVEEIDTAYLTPNMVRKIRKWLFGSINSVNICDDFTLLKYALASCGAVHNFHVMDADIGYTWKATEHQTNDMETYGKLSEADLEKATTIGTNWLEFHCRMVTSALRPVDLWYDPYDAKYYKGVWGEKYLEHRYRKYGVIPYEATIRENPHKVWDFAPRGIRETTVAVVPRDDLIRIEGNF